MENYKIILTFTNTNSRIEGTCAHTREECEQRISAFLKDNPDFEEKNSITFSVEKC